MTARVTDLGGVPTDGTFLFTVREVATGEEREAILVRVTDAETDGGGSAVESDADASDTAASHGDADDEPTVRGWLNYCRHLTHVRLDKGSGAPIRDDEILCTNHGAMFAVDSGRCTFGPCEGAVLEPVGVTVDGDGVYLDDEDYEFVGTGPVASGGDGDLTSTSNVKL